MSKSSEESPGRKLLKPTRRNNPSKRPQHPKPLSILPFTIYSKKPEQGIGPFRVDPIKKSYTVKKRIPTKDTKYRGVKSFNEKPKIKSYMKPVENVGDTDSKSSNSSNSSKSVYPRTRRPIVSNLSTNRGPIIPMEPVENATRTDSIEDGIHYSTDSNSKVITHSTPNKKTQRKKGRNKTRKSKSRAKHI